MKVAILDNSIDSDVYTPIAHWRSFLPVPWHAFPATKGEFPEPRDGFTHIILTGSEASIMEREGWVDEEVAFVQTASAEGIPILGSCYGHQLLSLALLGPEHVRRCAVPELGWLPINTVQKSSILPHEEAFYSFTLHFDEACDVTPDFIILAATERCPVHVMQHKNLPIWGIQAHPEIDIPSAVQLLQNFKRSDPARKELYHDALQMASMDSGTISHIVQRFLQAPSLL